MNACNRIHEYLDGDIAVSERISFEAHLADCSDCEKKVVRWQAFKEAARKDALENAYRSDAAEHFLRQELETAFIQNEERIGWAGILSRPVLVGAALAVCVALVLGVVWTVTDSTQVKSDDTTLASIPITRFHIDGAETKMTKLPGESIIAKADEKLLVFLADDRVAVGRKSQMMVKNSDMASTRLALLDGWIACTVSKRHGRERFFAETGDGRFAVEVKGTRFAVQYAADELIEGDAIPLFQVAVTDGVVEVTERQSRKWTLRADEQLVIYTNGTATVEAISAGNRIVVSELLEPKAGNVEVEVAEGEGVPDANEEADNRSVQIAPERESVTARKRQRHNMSASTGETAVSLAQIKQWIGMGRYQEAMNALEVRLKTENSNSESWRLLAECRRKTGNYQGALTAYRQVITYASSPVANAARYKMGLIYQDHLNRPADAIPHFSKYLAGKSQLLRAEALYHLGKAEYSVGQKAQAKLHLNEVVNNHSATAAAVKARRLLQKMGPATTQ